MTGKLHNNAFSVNIRYSMRLKEYGSFGLPLVHLYISVQEIVRFRHAIEDTHLITDTYSYPNTLSFKIIQFILGDIHFPK